MTLGIAIIFTACTNNNDESPGFSEWNGGINITLPGYKFLDIPAEYDSIGRAFGEYLTTISINLIDRGIENPTMEDIKDVAKEYYLDMDPNFDTLAIDTLDIESIPIDNGFLSLEQQRVVCKINNFLETASSANSFIQQIPTMVTLINALSENERPSVFIYLATIKHGIFADNNIKNEIVTLVARGKIVNTEIMVTQGFWRWLGNAACGLWALGRYAAIVSPGAAAVPFIDGACIAYGLAQLT
jgi:hypothetical protein